MLGRSDGTIILISAIQSIKRQLFSQGENKSKSEDHTFFKAKGHRGRVTALLYPYNDSLRYDPNHALSGGVDFSVKLWNISTGSLLNTFHVHGGEVLQMLTPPETCSSRVLNCVCSVASDHSVALLSIKVTLGVSIYLGLSVCLTLSVSTLFIHSSVHKLFRSQCTKH